MESNLDQLADVVSTARKAKGLTTRDVAAQIGRDQSGIVRLENASVLAPQPTMLAGLARVLDLNLSDLYALAGLTEPTDLPAFTPYLRSKFAGLPDEAHDELERSFRRIAKKYGYNADGPKPGEDEN